MSGRKARTLSDIGATDMRVDDFLNKLPQKTIVDGRPVDVREAIRERLNPSVEAPVPSDAFATIQVRAFNGARFVLKFGAGATVADLRYKIDAEVASRSPTRSARPSRRGATGTTRRRSRPRAPCRRPSSCCRRCAFRVW